MGELTRTEKMTASLRKPQPSGGSFALAEGRGHPEPACHSYHMLRTGHTDAPQGDLSFLSSVWVTLRPAGVTARCTPPWHHSPWGPPNQMPRWSQKASQIASSTQSLPGQPTLPPPPDAGDSPPRGRGVLETEWTQCLPGWEREDEGHAASGRSSARTLLEGGTCVGTRSGAGSSDRAGHHHVFAHRILIVFPFIFLLLLKKKGSSEDLHRNGEVNKYQHLWFL